VKKAPVKYYPVQKKARQNVLKQQEAGDASVQEGIPERENHGVPGQAGLCGPCHPCGSH
jgi:hypothetical protein